MKHITKASLAMVMCLLALTSCFKDEAPNAECDITQAYVNVSNPAETFFNLSDTLINVLSTDSVITFNVRQAADLSALAPQFKITEGATIEPASGSVHDFSNGSVDYVVTSEDKNWSRRYSVAFEKVITAQNDTDYFDFEHYSLESSAGKYYVWQWEASDGTLYNYWATGNAGFNLSMGSAKPEEYPTVPIADGYDGSAVQLTTRDTKLFGVMSNKRLAAGNLFLGTFDLSSALTETLKSTHFGIPFTKKPVKFTGYYKYIPGEHYQDRDGNYLDDVTDSAAIYAVIYKNHDDDGNPIVLYGDNIKTDSSVAAIAELSPVTPVNEWTEFNVDFIYRKEIDETVLADRGYNLTIVFSSSRNGKYFCGAIGSTLYVDKVRLISTSK